MKTVFFSNVPTSHRSECKGLVGDDTLFENIEKMALLDPATAILAVSDPLRVTEKVLIAMILGIPIVKHTALAKEKIEQPDFLYVSSRKTVFSGFTFCFVDDIPGPWKKLICLGGGKIIEEKLLANFIVTKTESPNSITINNIRTAVICGVMPRLFLEGRTFFVPADMGGSWDEFIVMCGGVLTQNQPMYTLSKEESPNTISVGTLCAFAQAGIVPERNVFPGIRFFMERGIPIYFASIIKFGGGLLSAAQVCDVYIYAGEEPRLSYPCRVRNVSLIRESFVMKRLRPLNFHCNILNGAFSSFFVFYTENQMRQICAGMYIAMKFFFQGKLVSFSGKFCGGKVIDESYVVSIGWKTGIIGIKVNDIFEVVAPYIPQAIMTQI